MDQFPSDGGHAAGVLKPLPALLRNCFFGDFFFFFDAFLLVISNEEKTKNCKNCEEGRQ